MGATTPSRSAGLWMLLLLLLAPLSVLVLGAGVPGAGDERGADGSGGETLAPAAQSAVYVPGQQTEVLVYEHAFTQLPPTPNTGVAIENGALTLAWMDAPGTLENETFDNGSIAGWNSSISGDGETGTTMSSRSYAFMRGNTGSASMVLNRTGDAALPDNLTLDLDVWMDGLSSSASLTMRMQAGGWRHDIEFTNTSVQDSAQVLPPSASLTLPQQQWFNLRLLMDANGTDLYLDGMHAATLAGSDTAASDLLSFSVDAGVTLRIDAARLDPGRVTHEASGWVGLPPDLRPALGLAWSHLNITRNDTSPTDVTLDCVDPLAPTDRLDLAPTIAEVGLFCHLRLVLGPGGERPMVTGVGVWAMHHWRLALDGGTNATQNLSRVADITGGTVHDDAGAALVGSGTIVTEPIRLPATREWGEVALWAENLSASNTIEVDVLDAMTNATLVQDVDDLAVLVDHGNPPAIRLSITLDEQGGVPLRLLGVQVDFADPLDVVVETAVLDPVVTVDTTVRVDTNVSNIGGSPAAGVALELVVNGSVVASRLLDLKRSEALSTFLDWNVSATLPSGNLSPTLRLRTSAELPNRTADSEQLLQTRVNHRPLAGWAGPAAVDAGVATSLDCSNATDDVDIVAWRIDPGDGTNATWTASDRLSHTYARPGPVTATCEVEDSDGIRSPALGLPLDVANDPPLPGVIVRLAGSSVGQVPPVLTVTEDVLVQFDASGTTDAPGQRSALVYTWSVDGSPALDASGATLLRRWNEPANHTISLTVEDPFGATANWSQDVRIQNLAPTGVAVERVDDGPSDLLLGASISLNGTGTDTLSDAANLTTRWILPNGSEVSGSSLTYTLDAIGALSLRYEVIDDQSVTTSAWWNASVDQPRPLLTLEAPASFAEGTASVVVGVTITDVLLQPLSLPYAVNIQGPCALLETEVTTSVPGGLAPAPTQPATTLIDDSLRIGPVGLAGTCRVEVTTWDAAGRSRQAVAGIEVVNILPHARLAALGSFVVGDVVWMTANDSWDTPDDLEAGLSCEWTIEGPSEDESFDEACWVAWTPERPGAYTVTVLVTDNDGDTHGQTSSVNVSAQATSDLASESLIERGFTIIQLQVIGTCLVIFLLRTAQAVLLPKKKA